MGALFSNPFPANIVGPRPTRSVLTHVNKLLVNNKKPVDAVDLGHSLKALQEINDSQSIFNGTLVSYLQNATAPLGNPFQSGILEVTLAANFTVTVPYPANAGNRLAVFITENSTGGWRITWDVMFKYATIDIDTRASMVNIFDFIGRKDPADGKLKWFATSLPLLSQQ